VLKEKDIIDKLLDCWLKLFANPKSTIKHPYSLPKGVPSLRPYTNILFAKLLWNLSLHTDIFFLLFLL